MITSHHNLSSLLIICILCIFKFGIPSYYDNNFSMKIKKYNIYEIIKKNNLIPSRQTIVYMKYNHISNLQLMYRDPTANDFFCILLSV